MSPLDPRLERFKPALVYDPQEAYRAMSAASITDNRDNALKRDNGAVVSRAGSGLDARAARQLRRQGRRPDRRGRRLPHGQPPLPGQSRLPRARLRPRQGGRRPHLAPVLALVLLQPEAPARAWASTRATGRSCRSGSTARRRRPHLLPARERRGARLGQGAPPGRSPDRLRRAALARLLLRARRAPVRVRRRQPRRHADARAAQGRGARRRGRAGPAAGARRAASPAASSAAAARPAPAARARSGTTRPPGTAGPRRRSRCARRAAWCARSGKATYPKLTDVSARREGDRVLVDYRLDPALQRRASRLLVTLHRADEDELVLASSPEQVSGSAGTVEVPVPDGVEGDLHRPRVGVQRAAPAQRPGADRRELKGTPTERATEHVRPPARPRGGGRRPGGRTLTS